MGDSPPREPATPGAVRELAIDLLDPNPFQPRHAPRPEGLEELAESIRAQGILQPILVRPHPTDDGRFQIIAGERRWRAAGIVGLHQVPVYVRPLTDSDAGAAALVENLQREDLNAIEEAEGIHRLINEFGYTHEAMGYALGKSRSHVTGMLRLLSLPPDVQEKVRSGDLSFGHARAMLKHPNPSALVPKIVKRGMSVRQAERLVVQDMVPKKSRREAAADPNLREIERVIAEALGLKVSVKADANGKGYVTIAVENWDQIEAVRHRLSLS
jgi:ParB family chromosome partitioning protein